MSTRKSAIKKPGNKYVLTIQLDAGTYAKMEAMVKELGISRSHLFRVLLAGAKVRHTQTAEPHNAAK